MAENPLEWEPVAALRVKPSLRAALDVAAKILGVITAATLPLAISAWLDGGHFAVAALASSAETFGLASGIIAAFLPAVQLAFTSYTFDDEGIRVRTQVLATNDRRVSWEKVTAIRQRRTIIDAMLGIERLDIIAYGERGATLHLVGLRNAAPLRDRVAAHMRQSASVESLFRDD